MNSISVVIPLYNKEDTICECLDSILSQHYEKLEIIVINDGSTDNSLMTIQQYENPIIKVFTQNNQGISAARNAGVRVSTNEWILFLDADDVLLPNSLETFGSLISLDDSYNVFCCNFLTRKDGKIQLSTDFKGGHVKNNFKDFFKGKLPMRSGSFVIRKDVFVQYPFDINLKRYEDLAWMLIMFKYEHLFKCQQPVMIYNINAVGANNRRTRIEEDFLGHLDFKGKSFWERGILYSLYEQAVLEYPNAKKMYSNQLKWQIDVKLFFMLIHCKQRLNKILSSLRSLRTRFK